MFRSCCKHPQPPQIAKSQQDQRCLSARTVGKELMEFGSHGPNLDPVVLFGSRGPIAQGSCLINDNSGLPFALLKLLSCCSVLWILGVSWSAQHPIVLAVATPAPVVWRSAPLVPDSYPTEQRNSRSPLSHVNPRLPVSHGLLRQFQGLWQELLLCVLMSHAGE